ncbi:MAG: hypothetical protein QOE70_315 [Chthoniobacter sp.]|jgi:cytidine deaminase|nr:hypothetical protein [Chthoniobacter sp.]
MPKALLRPGQYLLVAAMFAACGGHWLVLQSVAWGGMIVEYSRTAKLTVAVEKTFDGRHPCGLCKQIQTGKWQEQKRDAQVLVSQLEFVCATVSALVPPACEGWLLSVADCFSDTRAEQPWVPPPRCA